MGVWTTAPRTWAVSEVLTATNLNAQIRDFQNGFGAFTSYTPVWTAATTNPTIGNGSITGAYMQVNKLVLYYGKITLGSTTTVGSGAYSVSVPVAASAGLSGTNIPLAGFSWFRDTSPAGDYNMFPILATSTTMTPRAVSGAGGNVSWTAAAPVVPASGDWFSWAVAYEAA